MTTKTIGVVTTSPSFACAPTLAALGQALGVVFETRGFGDDHDLDGWLVLGADRTAVSHVARATRPCYVVLDESELAERGLSSTISFTARQDCAGVLGGRDITAEDAVEAKTLPAWLANVEPVALKDGAAVWASQTLGECRHHYVSLPIPVLAEGDSLFMHFSGRRLACLLPLVLFIRSVLAEPGWEEPPVQATFMFDDPNLHWNSYGYIDYREMVRHAAAGAYHVSIATIPLDAWFVYPPTVELFKEYAARLSLLCHGNDHVFRELARAASPRAMRQTLQQAVSRISGMEARTGLTVARVMAAPHGACGETALSEMAGLGFEALCVSRGSLQHHNARAPWTRTVGMKPCDVICGLAVIPRFGLSMHCVNDVLIAALLRQPIVAIGHHKDVGDGYGMLDEVAALINSLGNVAWRDMSTIGRALFAQRSDGPTLWIRMFSNRVTIPVPSGTVAIHIDRSYRPDSVADEMLWRCPAAGPVWTDIPGDLIAVTPGETIEIARGAAATRAQVSDVAPRRLAPIGRRLLTEARDRALPSVRRLARTWRAHTLA